MDKTNKNPIFSIKNFRSFGEDGADFELAPITVLTGCNSAGKSSLVKALLLLAEQSRDNLSIAEQVDRGYGYDEPVGSDLHAEKTEYHLGNFNKIINRNSKDGKVVFTYTVLSRVLNEQVRVTKVFQPAKTSLMTYGVLGDWKIEKIDGTILVATKDFDTHLRESDTDSLFSKLGFPSVYVPIKEKLSDEEYKTFCDEVLKDVPFLSDVNYVESASAPIKRLYSIDDNDRLSLTLRRLAQRVRGFWAYFEHNKLVYSERNKIEDKYILPLTFVNRWIKEFDMEGLKLDIKEDSDEGVGFYLRLQNSQDSDKPWLLADEGYGITQLITLLLQIENCMPNYLNNNKPKEKWIFVEEPEVHLHPKFQSKLADMFVEAYQKYNIHFIIETHSEYLIRKLQLMVADKNNALTPDDVSLNYVEKDENEISYNRQIKIKEDGRLDGSFGTGFYDEAGGLSRQLFMLND